MVAGVSARQLSVLHVITDLNVGGAESMLSALVSAGNTHGLSHRVVSILPGGVLAPRIAAAGVSVSSIEGVPPYRAPAAVVRLAQVVRETQPDVVQGWLYHGDLAATFGVLASLRRTRTQLAWGVRCSEMDLGLYGVGFQAVVRACVALSRVPDVVIANSHAGRNSHERLGYRPRRWAVVHNGIDVARFRPDLGARSEVRAEFGLAPESPVIAHVARVDPMKDHDGFFAAMSRLPHVNALLIGAGTERLPDRPNLRRLGRREDVPRLLAAADLVVSSSVFGEGFSNVLAEGMACGVPALATDVGDARFILGDVGRVVPPRDPAAFAQAMQAMLAEPPENRLERGRAARLRIVEKFSLESAARHLADLYLELIAKRAQSKAVDPAAAA